MTTTATTTLPRNHAKMFHLILTVMHDKQSDCPDAFLDDSGWRLPQYMALLDAFKQGAARVRPWVGGCHHWLKTDCSPSMLQTDTHPHCSGALSQL